jgi:radical SAM superfamily enzyme YgiQ (UPF0313 family)
MRVLLVHPEFPRTYWGFQYSLPFIHKKATLPPLGLVSVAALLPPSWELRLVDMNVSALDDEALRWADAVFVGGMLVQEPSMRSVLERAKRLGKRTVVGGPAPTTSPGLFDLADHVFLGEAEGREGELERAALGAPGTPRELRSDVRPDLERVPVPRFDLLDLAHYRTMSVQTSRGCPFTCEFCDIIEIFGRVPRVKSPEQVVRELGALAKLGYRGEVFVVDDNFIGNRKAVRALVPVLTRWQAESGHPFTFYTEASLNLARDHELVRGMVGAGFRSVFIGIETDSDEALSAAGKKQNVGVDVADAIDSLVRSGLEVMGGFIVGFDTDGPEAFTAQLELLRDAPLPLAMVGLMIALPETALWRRLEQEGRLRAHTNGDQFGRPNFETRMDELELLSGYAKLLRELYSPEAYFRRCAALVDRIGVPEGKAGVTRDDVAIALDAVVRLGVLGPRRRDFWRLVARGARRGLGPTKTAISCAIQGEHMIRYTEEDVVPRIERALVEARREAGREAGREAPRRRGPRFLARGVPGSPGGSSGEGA